MVGRKTRAVRIRRGAGATAPAGLALVLMLAVLLPAAVAGCGGTTAADGNEPNDGPDAATPLVTGAPVKGVLTAGDSDVFRSDAPAGAVDRPFVVTLTCDDVADVRMNVGASIPGVWEGITWPGWEAVATGSGLEVTGSLSKGTVLVFLKGNGEVAYTIAIAWR